MPCGAVLLLAGLLAALGGAALAQPVEPPPPAEPAQSPAVQPAVTAQPDTRPIRIQTIGIEVGAVAEKQLRAMAAAAGGQYFPAANEGELLSALGAAAGVTLGQAILAAESEPNNTFGAANPVAASGTVSGGIDPKGDTDWFALEVDQQGLLEVKTSNVPAELTLQVRVFNGDVYPLSPWHKAARAGAELGVQVDIPRAGRYYVQVADSAGATSAQPYTLDLLFHPGDGNEPNNTVGAATTVQPTGEYFLSILPAGDTDWFAFTVPQRGAVDVKISEVPADLGVRFRLHNAENYPLGNWVNPLRPGAETEATLDLPAASNYYLIVAATDNAARSPERFKMTLTYHAADRYEHNDTFGNATVADPNARLTANILPRGDVDFYSFRVDSAGAMDVAISNVPANLELQFRLFNGERYPLGNWVNPLRAGAENGETVDLPAGGLYYLAIKDVKDANRSADPYSLQLAWHAADAHEPNNTIEFATPIQLGQAVQGTILPKGDQDVYVFEVADEGDYIVAATNVPAELDIHWRLHNAENYPVGPWIKPLRAGADTREPAKLKPGRYYLYLLDGGHDARSTQPYTLTIAPSAASPSPP